MRKYGNRKVILTTIWNFLHFKDSKKNNFRGNYLRKYGSSFYISLHLNSKTKVAALVNSFILFLEYVD